MVNFDRMLVKHKINPIRSLCVTSKEDARSAAKKLRYPVAMKVVSKDILHKSDSGCVKVDLKNEKQVENAYEEIMKNAGEAEVQGMLVQKMARDGVELIIGGKQDPQFGQLILFGLGGIFVEVFKDYSMRVCPIERQDAREMIRRIKAYPILAGARGRKPVNERKLEDLLINVSKFLADADPREFDLNPIIINHRGYDLVDIRIIE